MTEDWNVIGHVISSNHRAQVLGRLAASPATPTQIAEDVDLDATHVSRAVSSLREHGLIALLVAEDRQRGRVYGITAEGEAVWDLIQSKGLIR